MRQVNDENKKVKISVIIPMYNAEHTIIRCLSTIVNTQYDNYEIIVIDDGSSDSSVMLVKRFMEANKYVKLLIQKNSGPSVARNKGMEVAIGDVIAFVDSDDFVNSDYLMRLADAFNQSDAEVVFIAFNRVTSNGDIISMHTLPAMQNNYYHNLIELSKHDVFGYTWIKAFRRNVIENNRFDNTVNLYEDEIFSCQVLRKPVNLLYLNEPLYCYVRSDETLVNKTNQNFSKLNNYVWNEWNTLLQKNGTKE